MALPLKIPPLLLPEDLQEIGRIGRRRSPAEACGVMIPTPYRGRRVWEMPNRSLTPNDHVEIHGGDVQLELAEWLLENEQLWPQIAIWHTHPGGHETPSRYDLENKLEDTHNLVVALTDRGPTPCWF